MKLEARVPLPDLAGASASDLAGPLAVHDGAIYFAARASPTTLIFHRIDPGSSRVDVERVTLTPDNPFAATRLHPSHWTLLSTRAEPFLHVQEGYRVGRRLEPLPWGRIDPSRISVSAHGFLTRGEDVIWVDRATSRLERRDVASGHTRWSIDVTNPNSYRPGPPVFFERWIACFGRQALLLVNPESGAIEDSVAMPRGERLYAPHRVDGDLVCGLVAGTQAGAVRFGPDHKARWTFKKRASEGAAHDFISEIFVLGGAVIVVHGESQLLAIDLATGKLRWTSYCQYLHGRPSTWEGQLVFGTSDGKEWVALNALSGRSQYPSSFRYANTSVSYAWHEGKLIVGDLCGVFHAVTPATMGLFRSGPDPYASKLDVGGALSGRLIVHDERAYTITAYPGIERPPELVVVKLGSGAKRRSPSKTGRSFATTSA